MAPLLLAAAAFPYALFHDRRSAGQRPGAASSPATLSATLGPTPTSTPTPTPTWPPTPAPTVAVRYHGIPEICAAVGSRSSAIIPDMDTGKEDDEAIGASRFTGISESHACRWATQGYWSNHPWGAEVDVDIFRFSSGAYGSAAFEKERTGSFYGSAARLQDFADDLCLANPTGKDYGYAHVMFRVDNLLVQVAYEVNINTPGPPAPAPSEARSRGLDVAKYVHDALIAGP